ncbi:hypothetical protein TRICI_003793 [Trichomonascus ciferrii]|uniref:Dienelactone hydrolase domain-containing protein n=1 Tax=Trichomonascus ciferrii TaxID=44093 RepID=A0A642V7Y4_9ASCO|nr:hypothetical protein TRICI_003793 [Trichomonascus ciferrii]
MAEEKGTSSDSVDKLDVREEEEQADDPYGDDSRKTVEEPEGESADETKPLGGDDESAGTSSKLNEEGEGEAAPPVPPKDEEHPKKGPSAGQKFVLSETGVEVYVSQHSVPKTKKLVILLTNSLGIASPNNMKLADLYSDKMDCPVIMPDLFDKDPIPTSGVVVDDDEPPETQEDGSALLNFFKNRAAGAVKGFLDEMWMAKHTYERTYPTLAATVAEIVEVFKPSSVAVIGYSFGGRYVMQLLEDHENNEWSSDEDLITVGASVHPSLLTVQDFGHVAKPLYFVSAADDEMLPDKLLSQGFDQLRRNKVDFDYLTISGERLPHGFAVPDDYPETLVGDRPYEVIDKVVEWISQRM